MKHKLFLLLPVFLLSLFLLFWKLDSVDLEASEDIYVADSVGYLRGDPFIVPRHHLRKPHYPASPHPFFVQFLTFLSFKNFGLSLFSARLVQVLATFLTVGTVGLISFALFKTISISIFTSLVFITIPLVVRFGRMAVLDPVLAFCYSLTILWSWHMVKNRGFLGYLLAAFAGLGLGLSISTKLTGIFFVIPVVLIYFWNFFKIKDRYFLISFFITVFTALGVFVLLTDPYSYYFAWTNFSDPKHSRISLLAIVKAFTTIHYWYYFVTGLLGIGFFVGLLYASFKYKKMWANERRLFISFWLLGPLSYLILNPIHVTGLSAEWSYFPLVVVLSLIAGKAISSLKIIPPIFVITIYLLVTLPFTFWYGLRFQPLPLANFLKARNVVMGDLAVTQIIDILNQEQSKSLVLIVTKGIDFPLWLVADHIATEPFYHPIVQYDFIVTDNQEFVTKGEDNGFEIIAQKQNPSEPRLFLLKNVTKRSDEKGSAPGKQK